MKTVSARPLLVYVDLYTDRHPLKADEPDKLQVVEGPGGLRRPATIIVISQANSCLRKAIAIEI